MALALSAKFNHAIWIGETKLIPVRYDSGMLVIKWGEQLRSIPLDQDFYLSSQISIRPVVKNGHEVTFHITAPKSIKIIRDELL